MSLVAAVYVLRCPTFVCVVGYFRLGSIERARGRYDEASEHIKQVLAIDPKNTDAWYA